MGRFVAGAATGDQRDFTAFGRGFAVGPHDDRAALQQRQTGIERGESVQHLGDDRGNIVDELLHVRQLPCEPRAVHREPLRLGLRDCYGMAIGWLQAHRRKPDFTAPRRAASHRVAMSGEARGKYVEWSRFWRARKNEANSEARHDSRQKLKPLKPQ